MIFVKGSKIHILNISVFAVLQHGFKPHLTNIDAYKSIGLQLNEMNMQSLQFKDLQVNFKEFIIGPSTTVLSDS